MRARNAGHEKTVRTPFQKFHGPSYSARTRALIGLTIGDQQVRRLIGVLPVPEPERIEARAEWAVRAFFGLFAPSQPHRGVPPQGPRKACSGR